MRVVQFLQVVVLLFLIGYAVLVYLENPVLLRLPLLFAGRELVLPAGLGLGLGVLVGALYGALLILPRYLRQRLLRRGDLARRRDAETRLQATLQAVIDAAGGDETQPEDARDLLASAQQMSVPRSSVPEQTLVEQPAPAAEESLTARAASSEPTRTELNGTEWTDTDGLRVRA